MTPDSLRSPEQKALAKNLEIILFEHCVAKDNHFEIAISKKEFKTIGGVPEIYYNILKKDIEDINHYLDTIATTVFVADSIISAFKKSKYEYFTTKK